MYITEYDLLRIKMGKSASFIYFFVSVQYNKTA